MQLKAKEMAVVQWMTFASKEKKTSKKPGEKFWQLRLEGWLNG